MCLRGFPRGCAFVGNCWKKSTGNDKVILTWNVLKIRGKNEVYIKYLVQFIG